MSEVMLKSPIITYREIGHDSGDGLRHKWIEVTISGCPKNGNVTLDKGQIGISRRLVAIEPSPLGEPFGVAWDGNAAIPSLAFKGAPAVARVLVSAWGV